ncbi:hypothetical protein BGZ73_006960 [Actinomortierella ambigua]|nr:hypothetical protein BGZ73_006960 [Actinomortierella ambigua]
MVSAIPEDRALSEDTQEQLIAPIDTTTILTHRPNKLSAFADDLLLLVSNVAEWIAVKAQLRQYGLASNAKISYGKTVSFPMFNNPDPMLKAQLEQEQLELHEATKPKALIYLGYPIFFSPAQRKRFWDDRLEKIQNLIKLLTGRSILVKGRALLTNAALLSKLWHVL